MEEQLELHIDIISLAKIETFARDTQNYSTTQNKIETTKWLFLPLK